MTIDALAASSVACIMPRVVVVAVQDGIRRNGGMTTPYVDSTGELVAERGVLVVVAAPADRGVLVIVAAPADEGKI